jgi:hypothetical protein
VYIHCGIKIHKAVALMFRRKKQFPWYVKAFFILIMLRVIYAFAKFFMKAADRHAGMPGAPADNKKL